MSENKLKAGMSGRFAPHGIRYVYVGVEADYAVFVEVDAFHEVVAGGDRLFIPYWDEDVKKNFVVEDKRYFRVFRGKKREDDYRFYVVTDRDYKNPVLVAGCRRLDSVKAARKHWGKKNHRYVNAWNSAGRAYALRIGAWSKDETKRLFAIVKEKAKARKKAA